MPRSRTMVVTGATGAIGSALARRLAATFTLPLMTKDTLKETLFEVLRADCLQSAPDRAGSRGDAPCRRE